MKKLISMPLLLVVSSVVFLITLGIIRAEDPLTAPAILILSAIIWKIYFLNDERLFTVPKIIGGISIYFYIFAHYLARYDYAPDVSIIMVFSAIGWNYIEKNYKNYLKKSQKKEG